MELLETSEEEVVLYDDREETHIPLVFNMLTDGYMYSTDSGKIAFMYLA